MKVMEYQEFFGKVNWQEGFLKELAGRSLKEQMRCFAFTEYKRFTQVPYQELEKEIRRESRYLEDMTPIPEGWYAIVNEGIVSGVAYEEYVFDEASRQWIPSGCKTVLPYQRYLYDTTSENNGSGYKTRDWYRYLVCLPYHHTLW